jgi:hypothetical protein
MDPDPDQRRPKKINTAGIGCDAGEENPGDSGTYTSPDDGMEKEEDDV